MKCLLLPFVCGPILPLPPTETLHRLASIQFTEQRKDVFEKRHCNWRRTKFQTIKWHVYWELATSLNIGQRVSVWLCLCVFVSVCVWVCACVSGFVWVCVSMSVCISVCAWVCVYECVWMCVSVCVSVSVCVRV